MTESCAGSCDTSGNRLRRAGWSPSVTKRTKEEDHMRARTISILAAIGMLGFVLSTARAEDQPDGTLKLSGGSVAVGIGYSWEGGTLTYKGKTYQVEVKGLSVGDVGITKAEASGDVYHMAKLSDFDGNYTAAKAGATV